MARILVTGAGGFIGRALCAALLARRHAVVATLRTKPPQGLMPPGIEEQVLGELRPDDGWRAALRGADTVIHLAQRAHRPPSDAALLEPQQAAFLAQDAARAGVRQLVYVSSIKAMGEQTAPGHPFRPDDPPHPGDAYGRAKLASEVALRRVAFDTGFELAIVRPPLVYGPGVRANFRSLMRLAASGLPLPFAAVDNRRSLVFRDNLVDLLICAATHPDAAGLVMLACDGSDFSTPELIRALARAQGRTARLFPVPAALLAGLCRTPRLGAAMSRLTTSLEIDAQAQLSRLGWKPPVTPEAAINFTVRADFHADPDTRSSLS